MRDGGNFQNRETPAGSRTEPDGYRNECRQSVTNRSNGPKGLSVNVCCPDYSGYDPLSSSPSAYDPKRSSEGLHAICLSALVTDAIEAWYHPSIARMTPNRRVIWQA